MEDGWIWEEVSQSNYITLSHGRVKRRKRTNFSWGLLSVCDQSRVANVSVPLRYGKYRIKWGMSSIVFIGPIWQRGKRFLLN